MKKVLYEELLPEECVQRIKEMPVAYLPLGTLEWHGPHTVSYTHLDVYKRQVMPRSLQVS